MMESELVESFITCLSKDFGPRYVGIAVARLYIVLADMDIAKEAQS